MPLQRENEKKHGLLCAYMEINDRMKKSKSAHGNPYLPHPEEIRRSMK